MVTWPRTWEGVRLLHGAEADIRSLDGRLFGQDIPVRTDITGGRLGAETTLYDHVAESCDYVIASVHYREFARDATVAQGTEMYPRAPRSPRSPRSATPAAPGFPSTSPRSWARPPAAAGSWRSTTTAWRRAGARGRTWRSCRAIAEACAELGCRVVVSSDAHICTDVGRVPAALELLEEIHFPQELVATRSAEAFVDALRAAGLDAPTD